MHFKKIVIIKVVNILGIVIFIIKYIMDDENNKHIFIYFILFIYLFILLYNGIALYFFTLLTSLYY